MKNREATAFRNVIADITDELERKSINYRVIGSVALEAHQITPVDFSPREEYVDLIDRRPDLDLLVPRSELKGAREVREQFGEGSSFPVKVGLAIPSMLIDVREGQRSYLTHGRKKLEIDSSVFDSESHEFQGVPISVVSSETLRHMYGHMSPRSQNKYANYLHKYSRISQVIGPDAEHDDADPYKAFHDYESLLNGSRSLSRISMDVFDAMTRSLSPELQSKLRKIALNTAGVIGWR